MLRKHLHLSVVLFDQLRCYLTHRIGVVRRTPARFRPECTIAVIPQVIGGINHFSQMPHLDALHIHFQEVIRDFIDKAWLFTLNGTEDGNKVITIVSLDQGSRFVWRAVGPDSWLQYQASHSYPTVIQRFLTTYPFCH